MHNTLLFIVMKDLCFQSLSSESMFERTVAKYHDCRPHIYCKYDQNDSSQKKLMGNLIIVITSKIIQVAI